MRNQRESPAADVVHSEQGKQCKGLRRSLLGGSDEWQGFFFSPSIWVLINWLPCGELGFPGGSDGKESACNEGDLWVWTLSWEDPLEEGMAIHSSILAWRIPMNKGTWQATAHGVAKSRTQISKESDTDLQEWRDGETKHSMWRIWGKGGQL